MKVILWWLCASLAGCSSSSSAPDLTTISADLALAVPADLALAVPADLASAFDAAQPHLHLYITQGSWQGNFGVGGAIAAADSLCQTDAAKPTTGAYKAVLVDGQARVACKTAGCAGGLTEHTGWPLHPSRAYTDDAGFVLTTNSTALFDFPLAHPLAVSGVYWTGLQTDWTTSPDNCGGWLTIAGASFGTVGRGDLTTSESIAYSTSIFCNNSRALLCAEQ